MAKCAQCGKTSIVGNQISFRENKTKRRFQPNIQTVTVVKGDKVEKVKICTRCRRTNFKTAR